MLTQMEGLHPGNPVCDRNGCCLS